jgi:hypothetical protein
LNLSQGLAAAQLSLCSRQLSVGVQQVSLAPTQLPQQHGLALAAPDAHTQKLLGNIGHLQKGRVSAAMWALSLCQVWFMPFLLHLCQGELAACTSEGAKL